jgi:hypothetical protein
MFIGLMVSCLAGSEGQLTGCAISVLPVPYEDEYTCLLGLGESYDRLTEFGMVIFAAECIKWDNPVMDQET